MVLVKEEEALEEIKEVGVMEVLRNVGYRAVLEGEATNAEPLADGEVIEAPAEEAEGDKENQPIVA